MSAEVEMMVMPANNTGTALRRLAARYPGRIGHIYSPGGQRKPVPGCRYALDNGAYAAWAAGKSWGGEALFELLHWAEAQAEPPLWVVVPDLPGDARGTIVRWRMWRPELAPFGWPLAFAAQDGMSAADVPADADVVFVGGTTGWKLRTIGEWSITDWCRIGRPVHVGRVNTWDRLWLCHDIGAASVDGSGFFRGDQHQRRALEQYLAISSGERKREVQMTIFDGTARA